jgi:phospholipase D1/2
LSASQDGDHVSLIGSIRSKVSRLFHIDGHQRAATMNDANTSGNEYASSPSMVSYRGPTMLDPSTNINPLSGDAEHPDGSQLLDKKQKDHSADMSKHTFYITNSQMRLKLCARNEVRQ